MRSLLGGVALVALTACGGAQTHRPPPPPPPPEEALAPVVEQRDPASRIVTLRVAFAAGSADDPEARQGAAYVAAHLATEGGTEALSATELTRALYPMAASIEVRVGRDQTVFIARVHRDRVGDLYPIFRDILLRPRMAEEDFGRVREQARAAVTLELRGGNDEALGKEVLQSMLYEGHPFGHPVVGTESGLGALTLDDTRRTRERLFCLGRATVGLAGGAPEGLGAQLMADLAALPRCGAARPALPDAPVSPARTVVLVDKPAATSSAISLGVTTDVVPGSPDYAALSLAFTWLGQHRQFVGRLFQALREKRGLNYGDYAYAEHFEQDGGTRFAAPNVARRQQYCSIWIRPVKPANAHFAVRAAVRELSELVEHGIPAAELEGIRTFARRYALLYTQTESRRLGFALDGRFYGMERTPVEALRQGWANVTGEQIAEALRRHVDLSRLAIAIVGPGARELADAIGRESASPITYDAPKGDEVLAEDRVIAAYPLRVAAERIRIVPVAEVFR